MGLESIQAVQARMAALEARFEAMRETSPAAPAAATAAAAPPVAGGAASFASLLDRFLGGASGPLGALDASGQGTASVAGHHEGDHVHVESTGKVEAPPELAAYGNGRIPAAALAPIGIGSHRLYAPAAQAFRQMVTDAAREGVTIGITDSYRSYEQQVDLAKRKGLYSQGGLAATPGTSNHGWGLATDLDLDDRAQSWMRANAGRYGFVEDVPREPWHWTWHGTAR